jgi:hypothetical protein
MDLYGACILYLLYILARRSMFSTLSVYIITISISNSMKLCNIGDTNLGNVLDLIGLRGKVLLYFRSHGILFEQLYAHRIRGPLLTEYGVRGPLKTRNTDTPIDSE